MEEVCKVSAVGFHNITVSAGKICCVPAIGFHATTFFLQEKLVVCWQSASMLQFFSKEETCGMLAVGFHARGGSSPKFDRF